MCKVTGSAPYSQGGQQLGASPKFSASAGEPSPKETLASTTRPEVVMSGDLRGGRYTQDHLSDSGVVAGSWQKEAGTLALVWVRVTVQLDRAVSESWPLGREGGGWASCWI
jgi:hypothetical protein